MLIHSFIHSPHMLTHQASQKWEQLKQQVVDTIPCLKSHRHTRYFTVVALIELGDAGVLLVIPHGVKGSKVAR